MATGCRGWSGLFGHRCLHIAKLRQRHAQLFSRRQQHSAFDQVFQFANVSWPRVGNQSVHGVGGNVQNRFVHAAAEFLNEVTHKQRNIFATIAQCRNLNRENVQTIVKVAAKRAVRHQPTQIGVRRCNDANIHANRPRRAQPFELLLLQHAQQLRLQLQGNVAYLVQKNCPFVGQFETPDFLADRSGKRAPFVAEKFAFQQAGRNRRAIHFYKGSFAPRAQIMNRPCDQFLSGPGFAQHQDGGVRGRGKFDLRERAFDNGTFADDLFKV